MCQPSAVVRVEPLLSSDIVFRPMDDLSCFPSVCVVVLQTSTVMQREIDLECVCVFVHMCRTGDHGKRGAVVAISLYARDVEQIVQSSFVRVTN